jgi:hypothetical protein
VCLFVLVAASWTGFPTRGRQYSGELVVGGVQKKSRK